MGSEVEEERKLAFPAYSVLCLGGRGRDLLDLIGLLTLGLLLLLLVSLETSALCDRVVVSLTEVTFDFRLGGGGGGSREGSSEGRVCRDTWAGSGFPLCLLSLEGSLN